MPKAICFHYMYPNALLIFPPISCLFCTLSLAPGNLGVSLCMGFDAWFLTFWCSAIHQNSIHQLQELDYYNYCYTSPEIESTPKLGQERCWWDLGSNLVLHHMLTIRVHLYLTKFWKSVQRQLGVPQWMYSVGLFLWQNCNDVHTGGQICSLQKNYHGTDW